MQGVLVEALKKKYQTEPISCIKRFYYEKKVPIEESFINLAILKQEEFKEKEKKAFGENKEFRDERLQSYEAIHQTKELIALPKIFDEEKGRKPKRLLIEGRAGIGKSTLCSFIANRWAAGDEEKLGKWIHQFKAIVWIPLRQLQNVSVKTLAEFIHRVCLLKTDQEQMTVEQLKQELSMLEKQHQILYLLDGYDEVSDLQNTDLPQLLLEKEHWLLTSRPYCGATRITTDRHFENVGFVEEDITRYVEKFFQHFNESEKAASLLELIQQNPNIKGIAHIPINLELLCSVWKEEYQSAVLKKTPLTMTVLYQAITRLLAKRYLQESCHVEVNDWFDNECETHPRCSKVLQFLEALAWQMMQQNALTFKPKAFIPLIQSYFPNPEERKALNEDIYRRYGLLKGTGDEKTSLLDQEYYFIHLTFQEYFAARYIVKHLEQEMIKFICAHKYHPRYQIVWWFVAGLLGQNTEMAQLQAYFDVLLGEPKTLYKIHQLSLVWRCWDEAELPHIEQHEELLKDLEMHISNLSLYWGESGEKRSSWSTVLLHSLQLSLNLRQLPKIKGRIIKEMVCYLELISSRFDISTWGYSENIYRWLILTKDEPEVINVFRVAWAQDENKSVRAAAIRSLVDLRIKNEAVIEAFRALLQDKDEDVRMVAIEGLVKLGIKDEACIKVLLSLSRDKGEYVRVLAIGSLVDLGIKDEVIIGTLWALLKDESWHVRTVAIRGLYELGIKDEAVIREFCALLQNEDESVQVAVIKNLVEIEIKDEAFIQTLLALLPKGIGQAARDALTKLSPSKQSLLNYLVPQYGKLQHAFKTTNSGELQQGFKADVYTLEESLDVSLQCWTERQNEEVLEYIAIRMQEHPAYWQGETLSYNEQTWKKFPLTETNYRVLEQACLKELKKLLERAFIRAAKQGDINSLETLKEEVDVNLKDPSESQATALHYAAAAGNLETVKWLLAAGADLMLMDANGETAMDWVMHMNAVHLLVDAKAKEIVKFLKEYYVSQMGNAAYGCNRLAHFYYRKNQLPLAIKYYEKVLSRDYTYPFAHHYIARCYHTQAIAEKNTCLLNKAERHFKQALALKADSSTYTDYGVFLIQQQRFSEVIDQLQIVLTTQLKQDGEWLIYPLSEKPRLTSELAQEVEAHGVIKIEAVLLAYYLLIIAYQHIDQLVLAKALLPEFWAMEKEVCTNPRAFNYALLGYSYKALNMFWAAAVCFACAQRLQPHYTLAQQNHEECQYLAEQMELARQIIENLFQGILQETKTFSGTLSELEPSSGIVSLPFTEHLSTENMNVAQHLLAAGTHPLISDTATADETALAQEENTENEVKLLQERGAKQTSSNLLSPSTYSSLSEQLNISKQKKTIEESLKDHKLQDTQPIHEVKLNQEQAQIERNGGEFKVAKIKSNTESVLDELADAPCNDDPEETSSEDEMEIEEKGSDASMLYPKI